MYCLAGARYQCLYKHVGGYYWERLAYYIPQFGWGRCHNLKHESVVTSKKYISEEEAAMILFGARR